MATEYTNQPRTRVVTRAALNNGVHENQAIGQTQAIAPKKSLFEDISIPQLVAGAAAAATSVALASKIGFAGSVIGAAVSSVVTVVSSQIYRRFLTAGAEKLKNVGSDTSNDYPDTSYPAAVDEPAASSAAGTRYASGARGARMAPAQLREKAAGERAATQKRVILFSVITAIAAVAISAGAILLTTAGEGLGERPESFILPSDSTTEQADDASNATQSAKTDSSSQQSDSSKTATASNDTSSNSTQSGNSSSDSTTGTSDANSSDNSPSSTSSDNGTTGDDSSGAGDKNSSDSNSSSQQGDSSTQGNDSSSSNGQ